MNIIYGIHKRSGKLLYIGQTKNLEQRVESHIQSPGTKLRAWLDENGNPELEFRTLGMYDDEAMAKGIEAALINILRPPLNDYCTSAHFRSKYIVRPKRGHSKLRA